MIQDDDRSFLRLFESALLTVSALVGSDGCSVNVSLPRNSIPLEKDRLRLLSNELLQLLFVQLMSSLPTELPVVLPAMSVTSHRPAPGPPPTVQPTSFDRAQLFVGYQSVRAMYRRIVQGYPLLVPATLS